MIKKQGIQKLKKCLIGGATALALTSCATKQQINQSINYKEVPHIAETSLNARLVKKQKPVDDEFLREEEAMLNELCFSDLYHLDANISTENDVALQTMVDYCYKLKTMSQRAASVYKRMEEETMKTADVTAYDILSIDNEIWSYRNTEVIKTTVDGVTIKNQGLAEDTDINAVRAAMQHRLHKFFDAKTLAFTNALSSESVALDKYELGYGFFDDYFFVKKDKQGFTAKIYNVAEYLMDDVIKYTMYEYKHGAGIENPAALEVELEKLFTEMERGLNSYGYLSNEDNSEKDMTLFNQAATRLVKMLPATMFGDVKTRKMLVCELATSLALEPLTRDLEKHGYDMSKFNPSPVVEQKSAERSR